MSEDRWGRLEEVLDRKLAELEERLVARIQKPQRLKIEMVNGKFVGITAEQREAWAAAYGAVDLESEIRRAAAWCVSNPHLAPKSQIGRFLNTWLTREQNRRSLQSIPTQKPTSITPSLCEYCLKGAVGATNGIRHCSDHSYDAMDSKPRPKMPGITPKAVSGA